MGKKHTEPTWLLSESWGVGVDSFNWILYHRTPGKKYWTAKSYHPNPEQLLTSFYQKLCRTETVDTDLARHVDAISRRVTDAAARLSGELNAMAWKSLSRPGNRPNP